MESHLQSQKDCYEKEIEALNFKVVHLSQEINHLQKLFREENDINESIRHEVTRLTSENMVWSQPRAPVMAIILEMLCISGVKFSVSAVKQITFPRSEIAGSEDKTIKLPQAGKHFKRVYRRIGPDSVMCVLLNLSILNLALTPWQVTKSIKVKRYLLRGVCIQKVSRPAHALHLTVSTASFFRDACSSPLPFVSSFLLTHVYWHEEIP